MKSVISVVGRDAVGIIAKVSSECADCGVNILDISQSVLDGYFTMIMISDIDGITVPFSEFVDRMAALGKENHLEIHAMHEDIFNAMHNI
ncbi:MAG: ACT domain-containing protein [Lentisphaeria bacterium]|nr:ACT domain-containing protein [Lentisphaerota bacterium]MBO5644541.1 ACT domain-containing protein [Lentisphaeria bacterium]MBO5765612.1 ACT domain-containing protein [Lentisphaeria bacterium]MBO5899790.1 ACT domain-containing protein [Lentisphaeria bacterium]MBO5990720.1 ACT domain-containing protein [Lentisphaeria bacterium]